MSTSDSSSERTADDGEETEAERLDRNLGEMLQELRVALPGVQVLFAFLLVVPFNQRFTSLTDFERDTYFVILLLTGLASVFLIAPTAHHRLHFRRGRRKEIVFAANALSIAGLATLAIAMTGSIFFIGHVVFGTAAAVAVGIAFALLFGVMWFAAPLKLLARLYGDK